MRTTIVRAAKTALMATVAGAIALGLASPAAASSARTMHGDPAVATKYWRLQAFDDCAIMAAADVVGQITGTEPSERAIIKVAQNTPSTRHPGSIYIIPTNSGDGNGTNRLDLPTLLAHYGVEANMTDADAAAQTGIATGIKALEQYLDGGHAVIVSLNAEMIWGQPVEAKDRDGNPVSDHAVVVTGIDTIRNIVHLNDSGTPQGKDEQIPLQLFVQAWATSHYFLLVTTGTTAGH
ncbi:hypothetical protein BST27_28450 [Mycobacterium intermedium]|uniref:Peptidase C39-like domain-containing protein n=1 Tax=Mycobacterium intermedium TaxID=28445 RepID=A0A1E3S7Q2_MYCIE|nr:C39 family peptidase [Mycobacterium intermedium]MCV6965333.1 C39 family peptidase [Mycobacterium intermedium]ODQ98114.1 hypothetical protein BHQ20_23460 [Mycobacterium intermedium]OPE47061.1 hypothetical protein BV508_23525 [Mycobacterium intermedium]ORA93831.1 hypothetical protein BST27_28450 [Mycobacterium intermedium]